jgi:hypothetical protein
MLCRQGSTSGKLFRSNYCAISARIAEFDFERATSRNAQRTSSQALHCLKQLHSATRCRSSTSGRVTALT